MKKTTQIEFGVLLRLGTYLGYTILTLRTIDSIPVSKSNGLGAKPDIIVPEAAGRNKTAHVHSTMYPII